MVGFNNNVDYVGGINLDPNGASDGTVQYAESTTAKWIHGNDATDDSFRLSQGSALGTNDTFIMTAAGERTMPLQPAFFAYQGTLDENVTGGGTVFILGDTDVGTTLTESYDQNGDFTPGASGGAYFTAPVTGIYRFDLTIHVTGVTSAMTQGTLSITDGTDFYLVYRTDVGNNFDSGTQLVMAGGVDLRVTASTEIRFRIDIQNGTDAVDIRPLVGTSYLTWVSGRLIC